MAKKKIDLEQILIGLSSDEARARAISKLIRKGDLPIPKISWVIEYYEKAGRFYDAADIALKAGMNERAVEDYEKAGRFDDAASVALEAGMKERAEQLYQRAVEVYEKAGRFDDAASVALKAGMNERAEQLKTLVDLINE